MTRLQTGLCDLFICLAMSGLSYAVETYWTGDACLGALLYLAFLFGTFAFMLLGAFNVIAGLEGLEEL